MFKAGAGRKGKPNLALDTSHTAAAMASVISVRNPDELQSMLWMKDGHGALYRDDSMAPAKVLISMFFGLPAILTEAHMRSRAGWAPIPGRSDMTAM